MLRERGVYSLLRVSGAPLMRVWGISRTSGAQNLHFDAKINIACASLGRKSHKRSDLPLHAEDIVVNDFGEMSRLPLVAHLQNPVAMMVSAAILCSWWEDPFWKQPGNK